MFAQTDDLYLATAEKLDQSGLLKTQDHSFSRPGPFNEAGRFAVTARHSARLG